MYQFTDISEVKILPILFHTNICTHRAINNNVYLISFLNKYVQELMLTHITIHNTLQGTTCLIKNPTYITNNNQSRQLELYNNHSH